jgi:hypothetical protein
MVTVEAWDRRRKWGIEGREKITAEAWDIEGWEAGAEGAKEDPVTGSGATFRRRRVSS